jgi:LmbE family N-acetylglucosaminyl deacetylase
MRGHLCTILTHQDDEALFTGGLLSSLRNKVEMTLICVFRPRPYKPQTATRVDHFVDLAEYLNAMPVLMMCATSVSATDKEFARKLASGLRKLLIEHAPDWVITHNPRGEYGHEQHRMVSRAVRRIHKDFPNISFNVLGNNLPDKNKTTVSYDRDMKKKLLDFYLPEWEPFRYGFDFAYDPETYVPLDQAYADRSKRVS